MPLNAFQTGAVALATPTRRSILMCVGTGQGKTLASIRVAHAWGYTTDEVMVVSPNRMAAGIYKGMRASHPGLVPHDPAGYAFHSFQALGRSIVPPRKLLIVDEVHQIRGMGVRFRAVLHLARAAERVILLTATPMVNGAHDLCAIVNLLNPHLGIGLDYFKVQCDAARKDPVLYNHFRKYFATTRVSTIFLPNHAAMDKFPRRRDHVYTVPHDHVQRSAQRIIRRGRNNTAVEDEGVWDELYATLPAPAPSTGNTYLNATRQIANMGHLRYMADKWVCGGPGPVDTCGVRNDLGERRCLRCHMDRRRAVRSGLPPKLLEILGMLERGQGVARAKGGPRFRAVITSSWVRNGAERVQHLLDRRTGASRLRVRCIVGRTRDRAKMIRRYNREGGTRSRVIDVLCISAAGSESITLKETHQVHILDQHWNTVLHEQAIGRAIRFGSHHRPAGAPRPVVDVYHWHTRSRAGDQWTTEEWLRMKSEWKRRVVHAVEHRVLRWAAQQTHDARLHGERGAHVVPAQENTVYTAEQHHGPRCACARA